MPLRPVEMTPRPQYPEGPAWRRGLLRWTRRVLVATGAVVACGLAGCYSATRFERDDIPEEVDDPGEPELEPEPEPELPPPRPCELEERLSGARAPIQYFACGDGTPDLESIELPLYLGGGQSCDEGLATAWFEVAAATRLRVGLSDWEEAIIVTVFDADGRVLTTLGPGPSCSELDVAAGEVGLAAEATLDGIQYFEFSIDVVDEESG